MKKYLIIVLMLIFVSPVFASEYNEEEINLLTNEISCESIEKYKQEIKTLPLKKQELLMFIYSHETFQEQVVKPKIKSVLQTITKKEMLSGNFSNKTNQNFEKAQLEIQEELNKILISLK